MSAVTGHNKPVKGTQSITRGSLGRSEARFLARVSGKAAFTTEEAQSILKYKGKDSTQKFLERLQTKGWIRRIKRGRFAIIPLSSGENRTPQLHEFIVAMELVSPAAIAYWSALNHHGMTEQLPRTVFVSTNHPVRRPPGEVLGVSYKIISLRPEKFFGIVKDWIDEMPFMVTDREKTIIDGLDLPQYVGGVAEIAKALSTVWTQLNESKLRKYVVKIGNSAVAKRLGFIMEMLKLGDVERLRKVAVLAPGFSPLDPTLPRHGKYNRRWGLLINTEIKA
jgi:predicted transcriptional regulator of viral defense system